MVLQTFTEIPDGQHQIIISFLGFEAFETTIQIPSNSALVFKLKEGGNQLDAVVLQSSRSTRTVRKNTDTYRVYRCRGIRRKSNNESY